MKIGFLYAGQGSQAVGMGKDLYDEYPEFKAVMDSVSLPFDVKDICFNGPAEILNETKYTQPCMVAFAVGVTKILAARGIKPDMAAGLSLGEYSALNAAGVLSDSQVVELVAFRGQSMQEAVSGRDCKMIAVLGLERDKIYEGCRMVAEEFKDKELNVAEPANFNCPGQITVSGDAEPVDRAAEIFKELGAKRCVAVKVSGPFHTSLMKPAGDKLRERFKTESFGEMQIPVIFNAIGKEKPADTTVEELLEKQVQSSVFFEDTIRYMAENGVDTFVEIGPGKTLSKFVSKTLADAKVYGVEKKEDVDALVQALGQAE
ncbi:MAG: ACP S-malonyltransferase [Eubacterium sp.]|nr:ACP S-malonyltransferase [Eubacterium sp.]HBE10025.1 [acyl-carrier-protein] S-malonyltransferase [Lachnospiraceae bacterium]